MTLEEVWKYIGTSALTGGLVVIGMWHTQKNHAAKLDSLTKRDGEHDMAIRTIEVDTAKIRADLAIMDVSSKHQLQAMQTQHNFLVQHIDNQFNSLRELLDLDTKPQTRRKYNGKNDRVAE